MKKMFYIENCDGVVVCWVPCALFFASRCCRCQRRWTARGRPGANFFYFFLLDQESESESSVLCGCLASLSSRSSVVCALSSPRRPPAHSHTKSPLARGRTADWFVEVRGPPTACECHRLLRLFNYNHLQHKKGNIRVCYSGSCGFCSVALCYAHKK